MTAGHVSMRRISSLDGSIWTHSDLDVSDCWIHAVALVAFYIVDNTGPSTITSTLVSSFHHLGFGSHYNGICSNEDRLTS